MIYSSVGTAGNRQATLPSWHPSAPSIPTTPEDTAPGTGFCSFPSYVGPAKGPGHGEKHAAGLLGLRGLQRVTLASRLFPLPTKSLGFGALPAPPWEKLSLGVPNPEGGFSPGTARVGSGNPSTLGWKLEKNRWVEWKYGDHGEEAPAFIAQHRGLFPVSLYSCVPLPCPQTPLSLCTSVPRHPCVPAPLSPGTPMSLHPSVPLPCPQAPLGDQLGKGNPGPPHTARGWAQQ